MSMSDRIQFLLGFLLAAVMLGSAAEAFLRYGGLVDLDVTLAEHADGRGPFVADRDFSVRYRSWNDLYTRSAGDLAPWLAASQGDGARPTWLFVGSSFVHGAGMMVDHVRATVPERYILTLHRTDPLPVRLAQIDLLRQQTARLERIFIPLGAVDLLGLGDHPLATLRVTNAGVLTFIPRLPPGPGAWLVQHSRAAESAWFRTGRQRGNPEFDKRALDAGVGEWLQSDLRTLFSGLARRAAGIPMTVIVLPSHQQLVHNVSNGFQRELRALLQPLGYDVFDPLPVLQQQADRAALFLPDKHFSPVANELLVAALLKHLQPTSSPPPGGGDGRGGPR
jgi:hypothetical protein